MKILQFSPHNENCGVGKYQENFVNEVAKINSQLDVVTDFYDTSPYQTRTMSPEELGRELQQLQKTLREGGYDILHVQHEFGLFSGDEFARIVDTAKEVGVKVVVTVHLSPALAFKFKPREGIGPRSIVQALRQKRLHGIFVSRHITAFRKADLLITHNNGTTKSLVGYGVDIENILQIKHPVIDRIKAIKSNELAENLNKKEGDIIYATVGFMHKYKGFEDAIRALKFLPNNYKLAILGGMQPISDEKNIYNYLCNLIDENNLKDRVYITGYVESDDRLNALIQEADACVYPYDNRYYGQVSSGALNLAFANNTPVVAYPVDSFKETNDEFGHIKLTSTFAYYELARELQRLDVDKQRNAIKLYSDKYSWHNIALELCEAYKKIAS